MRSGYQLPYHWADKGKISATLSGGLRFLFFGRQMVADNTTPHRADDRMVFKVADSGARHGAFETAIGVR